MYLKEIKYKSLKEDSEVIFTLSDGTIYRGKVKEGTFGLYIHIFGINNYTVFAVLGIKDKRHNFVKEIVGYPVSGDWPEVKSEEDLKKVLNALLKVNKSIAITPIKRKHSIKLNFKL